VDSADAIETNVERVAHAFGGNDRDRAQATALWRFCEFDTQPRMPPCALIISSATRWNSGKKEATQSLRPIHS
jgi:hypothetical protein